MESPERYLAEMSPDSRRRISDCFAAETSEFALLVGAMRTTLTSFNAAHARKTDDPRHIAFGLMVKATNSLMAGFELALIGYRFEPAALFRVALESSAVAWDVVQNPERLAQWKSDKKFSSTHSVSRVKELISIFGNVWGMLSEMNIHISPLNSSPSMFPGVDGEEPTFQYFGFVPPGREAPKESEIYFSLFAAYICLQLTESIFYEDAPSLETWEMTPGSDQMRSKVSERHRKFVDEMKAVFLRMSQGLV